MGRPPLHGKRGHPLYVSWRAMRWRCLSPQADSWGLYGGRGITVSEEWDDFRRFYDWAMANGWKPGLSIDRINADGNYEPDNCRWATAKEQCANRRERHWGTPIRIGDDEHTLRVWAKISGLRASTMYKRYKTGVRGSALIAPPDPLKSHKRVSLT